jgi:hypothetical protein
LLQEFCKNRIQEQTKRKKKKETQSDEEGKKRRKPKALICVIIPGSRFSKVPTSNLLLRAKNQSFQAAGLLQKR